MVISIPNVAHADMRLLLLEGRWTYQDTGLLDRTHLRFFTRESLREFLAANGLTATRVERVVINPFTSGLPVAPRRARRRRARLGRRRPRVAHVPVRGGGPARPRPHRRARRRHRRSSGPASSTGPRPSRCAAARPSSSTRTPRCAPRSRPGATRRSCGSPSRCAASYGRAAASEPPLTGPVVSGPMHDTPPIRLGIVRPAGASGDPIVAEIDARVLATELARRLGPVLLDLRIDGPALGRGSRSLTPPGPPRSTPSSTPMRCGRRRCP